MVQGFIIAPIAGANREAVRQRFIEQWGSALMVSRGKVHVFDDLEGYVAMSGEQIAGAVTFREAEGEIELVSLDSWQEHQGIGSALLDRVTAHARTRACRRLWLITTNDNLPALKFYQKRNWRIIAVHWFAVQQARKVKPEIPEFGFSGIPIYHEIELEFCFDI